MTRVEFYELKGTGWEAGLCERVEALAAEGGRVYLWAAAEADARRLDDLLWTFRDDSFVPHDLWEGGAALDSPVAVGWARGNPNAADCLVLARDAHPDDLRGFSRAVDFAPVDDPGRIEAARARFRAYRAAGLQVAFHRAP
ncbi:MAG: DNA polymerase III subunit chi [Deferrisomatales bacterium]